MLLNIIFRCLETLVYFLSCDPDLKSNLFSQYISV